MHGRGGQTTSDGCNDVVGVHHGPVGWNQVCVAQEAEVFEGFQYEPACEIARLAFRCEAMDSRFGGFMTMGLLLCPEKSSLHP